jgi:hypothetical protein
MRDLRLMILVAADFAHYDFCQVVKLMGLEIK